MTMDVSRLGIVVESTGIDKVTKELQGGNGRGGLFGAAEKTEKSVVKLTDSLAKLSAATSSGTATAWNNSLAQLNKTVNQLTGSLSGVVAGINSLGPALDKLTAKTLQANAAKERTAYHGNVVVNTLKAMTTAAVAYTAVNFGMSIVKQADSWQMMTARLQNATGSLNNAKAAQQQMFELSQRLRVPLEDSVKLYTRLAPAVQRLGKDSNYAKNMVEGISTALQLSGANGAEASSVMLQLSQSFSSGVLNGQEFNAVAENGSVLMRALEKYTGKSTYELKKLGSEGKLSMETVGKAIEQSLPEWREKFDRLPITFESAMQRLKNAWTKAVGDMGQDTGFNKELSQSLRVVEELIPAVAQGLGNAFITVMGWVQKNKSFLSEIWDQIVGLGKDIWKAFNGFTAWIGAIAGAGEEFSVVAAAIYAVRLGIAGFQDGMKIIVGLIASIGGGIIRYIAYPLSQIVAVPLRLLIEAFGWLIEKMGDVAEFVGLDSLGAGLKTVSSGVKGVASALETVNKFGKEMSEKAVNLGVDLLSGYLNGKSAVAELLAEEKKLTAEKEKQSTLMDETDWNASKNPKKKVDEKAAKATQTVNKQYESDLEGINKLLQEQITLRDRLEKDGNEYDKLGPAQKKVIELQEHLKTLGPISKDLMNNLKITNTENLLAIAELAAFIEVANNRTKERLALEEDVARKQASTVKTLQDEAAALERKVATYGKAKGAIEAMELAAAKAMLADLDSTADSQRNENIEKRIKLLQQEIMARERIAAASGNLGSLEAEKAFDKLFDARKAEKFGNVLADGFGRAGKALGNLMNSMGKYEARQAKIAQGKNELSKMDAKSEGYAKRAVKLADEEAEARMASYADMTGAAKTFFEEGSAGYKTLEAAEKAFRIMQMALQMKSFLQEIGLLQASTAATLTANATKMTSDQVAAASGVASSMAEGTAAAVAGVANQAKGDPYSAWARMAAMAAVMAALGFAVGGVSGKGSDVAKMRQDTQGTGTVFGDEKAKSASIAKSLELLSRNSDIALRYSSGMLSSLQNIEYNLTGATSGIIRTGGTVTGKDFQASNKLPGLESALFGGVIGLMGNLIGRLVGGKIGNTIAKLTGFSSSSSLLDSGLMASNQSVGSILQNGFNVQGYQDVQTKKKAFGITYSNKTSTNTSPVDPAVSNEFKNIVMGMVDSLVGAASALGESGDVVRQKLAAVNIDIGKISLKGLSGDEIQKQLEAVFSAIGDKLSSVALPMVTRFQKAGEGLLETAVRVATGVETASYELEKLGITAIKFQQLVNTTGDVGAEIVRESILRQETAKGISEIVKTLTGDATAIAETYKSLTKARASLAGLGLANDVTRDLIRAAGGLDALQDSLDSYSENFFSDAEKTAMKTSALRSEFAKLGLSMPATKEGFRSLVESLFRSGASGQELAAKVLLLAESFAELESASDNLISNARDDLADAYERESKALEETRDRFKDFAKSLLEFRDSLLTGDLSTLNVAEKYQAEKTRFDQTLEKAKSGDEEAISKFQEVASAFLNASRTMNASNEVYTADFQRVLAETEAIAGLATNRASVAEQQLTALEKQVAGLIEINKSVLTVAEAIARLNALLSASAAGPNASIMPVAPGVQTASAPVVNTQMADANAALIAEIQSLRAEVSALRADQAAQTGDLIVATHESALNGAHMVREGAQDMVSAAYYKERVEMQLV